MNALLSPAPPARRWQIDLVPRHRRRLAIRERLDCYPCKSQTDDAAAAAVFPGRFAQGCDRLPCGSECIQLGSGKGCSRLGRPASARVATGGRGTLESNALARRATTPWARTRAAARAAIPVSR